MKFIEEDKVSVQETMRTLETFEEKNKAHNDRA